MGERTVAEWLGELLVNGGWVRFLPPGVHAVLHPFCRAREVTADEVAAAVLATGEPWGEVDLFTAEDFDEMCARSPLDESGGRTVEQVNAGILADHEQRLAEVDGYAAQLGVAAPCTVGRALDYLVACGLLQRRGERYRLNLDPPDPSEVFELGEEARAWLRDCACRQRWQVASAVMRLAEDPAGPLGRGWTTLRGLGAHLATDIRTVRGALVVLLDDPDAVFDVDPDRVGEDQRFSFRRTSSG
ncbi:DUF6042 family protein [Actinokineospora bangkokensis]|nr:DUF6042 family protein [Actinokineospora bangkokensis]